MRLNLKNHEQFKNICSGIQSLSVALAVIIGGLWAAYVFNTELKVEKAKAQLKKINRELESKAKIDFEFIVEKLSGSDGESKVLSVVVKIHNKGNGSTILTTTDSALRMAKLIFSKNGELQVESVVKSQPALLDASGQLWKPNNWVIGYGEINFIRFLINVKESGIYLLTFEAEGLDADTEEAWKVGVPRNQKKVPWVCAKYIKVD